MRRVLTRCYTYLQMQAVVSFELRTLYELRATPLRLSCSSSLSQARTQNHTCKAPYTPQPPTREEIPGARCHGWSVAAASCFCVVGESITKFPVEMVSRVYCFLRGVFVLFNQGNPGMVKVRAFAQKNT